MSFWTAIKIFFARLGISLYMRFRIYSFWSKLYRLLFEGRYRNIEISTYQTFADLEKFTRKLVWTADTWQQLFDAVSLPQKVEYIGNWQIGDKRVGDCDEFAIYITAAINKSIVDGVLLDMSYDIRQALFFTVMWMDADGVMGGHNVSLLALDDPFIRQYLYMDYGMPRKQFDGEYWIPFNSIDEVAEAVRLRYAGTGNTSLGWAIHSGDMKFMTASWS